LTIDFAVPVYHRNNIGELLPGTVFTTKHARPGRREAACRHYLCTHMTIAIQVEIIEKMKRTAMDTRRADLVLASMNDLMATYQVHRKIAAALW
jgi:hypothetical protein